MKTDKIPIYQGLDFFYKTTGGSVRIVGGVDSRHHFLRVRLQNELANPQTDSCLNALKTGDYFRMEGMHSVDAQLVLFPSQDVSITVSNYESPATKTESWNEGCITIKFQDARPWFRPLWWHNYTKLYRGGQKQLTEAGIAYGSVQRSR